MTLSVCRPKQHPSKSPVVRADTNTVFVDDEAEENWFSIGLRHVRERKELRIERNELKVKVAYLKKELKNFNESYLIHKNQLEKALELIQDGKALIANRNSKIETIEHELKLTKETVKARQKTLKDKDTLGQIVTCEKYDETQHLATVIKAVKERNIELANLTQKINVDKLSSELNTATANLTTVTTQRDDLQKALEVAQDNIVSYKSELRNQDRNVSGLNEKLSCATSELKSLGSDLSSTTVSLSKPTTDCDTLQKSLESARKQVVFLQSTISEQTVALSKDKAIRDTKTAEGTDLDTITDKCTHSNGDLGMVVKKSEQLSAMIFEAQQKTSEIDGLKQALKMAETMLALSASTNLQTINDEGRNLKDHQLPASEDAHISRIIKSQAQELTRYGARIAKQEEDIINVNEINGDLQLEVLHLRSVLGDVGPCTRFGQAQKGETKEWCECIKCSTYKHLSKKFLVRIQLLEEENFIMGEQIKGLSSPHPEFIHLEKLHAMRIEQLEFEARLNKAEIQYLKKKAAVDKAFYNASQTSSENNSCFKQEIFEGIEPVRTEDQEDDMEENAEEDSSQNDDDYDDSASDSSVEFVGTDNLKKPTPKSATVVQDPVKRTETISPPTTKKSASSESKVSTTIIVAKRISTLNLPNDTPVPNDNMAINAIIPPCSQLDVTDLKAIPEGLIDALSPTTEKTSPVQYEYAEFLNGLDEDPEKDNACNDIDVAEYNHEQHEVEEFGEEDDYDLELAEFLAAQETIAPLDVSQGIPLPLVVSKASLKAISYTRGPISNLWNDEGTAPSLAPSSVESPSEIVSLNMAIPCSKRHPNRFGKCGASHQLKAIIDVAQQNRVKEPSLVNGRTLLATTKVKKVQSTPMSSEPKKVLALTVLALTPTAPVFKPAVPVIISTAAVMTSETTMAVALVQEHAEQEDIPFGMADSVHYPATNAEGSICKSEKRPGSLWRFCDKSNRTNNKKSKANNKPNGKPRSCCKHCGDPDHKQEQCPKYKYFMQMNNEIKYIALCSTTPEVEPLKQPLPVAQSTRVAKGNRRAGGGRQTPQLCKFWNCEGHIEKNFPKKEEEDRMLQKIYGIRSKSTAPSTNLPQQLNSALLIERQPPKKKTGGVIGSKYAPESNRDNGNSGNNGYSCNKGGNGKNGGNGQGGGQSGGQRWNNNRRY